MDVNTLITAATGFGILLAGGWSGWQSVQAKRHAKHARSQAAEAASYSKPTGNGFAQETREQLTEILVIATEGRDAAVRAEDKVDRHLEAHANGHIRALAAVAEGRGR